MICEKHDRKNFVKKNSGNWKFFFSQNKGFFLSFYQQKKILKNSYPFWLQSHFYKKKFQHPKNGQNFFLPKNQPKEAQRANYTYGGYHGPITYQYGNFSPPTQFTPFMVCYTFLM